MSKKIKIAFFCILLMGMCFLGKGEILYAQDIHIKAIASPGDIPAIAVEMNTDVEQIREKLSTVTYTLYTEEEILHIPVTWEISGVNMNVRGTYLIKGRLTLPQTYVLEEGVQAENVQTMVSVQSREIPDINAYYKLTAAGLYIFPWLERTDSDDMSVWLKKDGGNWIDLTKEGLALCDAEGLYLSNQSMIVGNTYSLTVKYSSGQTKILRFACQRGGTLQIYSYVAGQIGEIANPLSCIRSYNKKGESFLTRCGAYAVALGDEERLEEILNELTSQIKLDTCTNDTFQTSSEYPLVVLNASWDASAVRLNQEGVYRLTGTFEIPDGYTIEENLKLPKAYAYVSVQKKGKPQIDTYSMPSVDIAEFPVLFDGFDTEKIQIYLKEDQGTYRRLSQEETWVTSTGIQLACRSILKKGSTYSICAVYEQGSTGIYTFEYNDDFLVNDYWHERNFSDREEKELPDIIQDTTVVVPLQPTVTLTPAPTEVPGESQENIPASTDFLPGEMDNENSSQAATRAGEGAASQTTGTNTQTSAPAGETDSVVVTETSTDTVTVISGQRFQLMFEQNGSARFEKQGISLNLSAEATENWKIRAEDEIQIMIEKVSEQAFSVRIFVRGEEMTEIPGSYVEFPVSEFDMGTSLQELTVEDDQGNPCTQSYQQEQEILRVDIAKTGDYFLVTPDTQKETVSPVFSYNDEETETDFSEPSVKTEESVQDTQKTEDNRKPVIFTGLLAAAALGIFAGVRKKKKNRKQQNVIESKI